MSTRPLRFLFVMHYPGYLRYFDSAVRLLAAHGHHVEIAFDSPDKQSEGTEAVADHPGIDLIGQMPIRRGVWGVVARGVRGAIDYLRYRHPDFADTPYLRDRMRSALPGLLSFLANRNTTTRGNVRRWVRVLQTCERAIPSSSIVEAFIASRRPDAVLVTPLVTDCSPQADVVKSAQRLGIPTALCVASWDHLTTKGLIRVDPDLVAIWNEEQRAEAIEYHGTPNDRLLVTGAQPFDKWFERRPTPHAEFCAKVGLRADRPFVLWVGSTKSISGPDKEFSFVLRWIAALRQQPELRDVSILIRPHPFNGGHWLTASDDELPADVAVYPRGSNPVNEGDRQDYFDSLYHCAAVVGVNTTAMIEAAIVGRTVHSVLADEFKDTQGGTLHFRYLLAENGGFLRVAHSMSEHSRQVAETLRTPDVGQAACARFVARFIRPQGIDVEATPILAEALERLASARRARAHLPIYLYPLTALLWLVGLFSTYTTPARISGAVSKQYRILQKRVRRTRKGWARARMPGMQAADGTHAPVATPDNVDQANEPTRRVG
jgi:hypothetical protein